MLAHPAEPGDVRYFHVSSGDRNPLTFRFLYDTVRAYFDEHPFTAGDRGAARLPDWRFPGARSVERLLSTSEKAWKVADYVVGHAPRSDRTRDLARKLHQQGRRLEFLRRYLDLYMEYATAELRFSDKQTMALFDSLSAQDRRAFAFDTSVIDWRYYLMDVHCPAITAPVRRLDELRALRKKPAATGLRGVGSSGHAVAAFFDMDGTLLSSNVIETYLWVRLRELDGGDRLAELGRIASKVPNLVQAERRSRSEFLRGIYREYEGARLADLDAVADEHLTGHILSRLSPDAVRRIREHRAAGHHTVLITGAIRPLTRPLRPLFDHIEAADLAVDDRGVCTGFLAASPLVGESRAAWMRSYADDNGFDMRASLRVRRLALRPARCSRRSATRSRSGPTCRSTGMRAAPTGTSSTGPARPARSAPSTPPAVVPGDARARDVPQPAPHGGRQGDRHPDARHPVRLRGAAAAGHHRPAVGGPARAGRGCAPGCPASAAPTSARCRARRRSTSPRWSRCRSYPATRWSPSCSRTARTSRPAPGSCSTRC